MSLLDLFIKKEKRKPKTKITTLNGVEYKFVKIKNAKSFRITVKDCYHITVSIPHSYTFKDAKEIAAQNKEWIEEHLEKAKEKIVERKKPDNLIVERGVFITSIKKRKDNIIFTYPVDKDFYSKEIQEEYKKAVKKALYIKAKSYLPERLDKLALRYGFEYKKLALKAHKTRWGSCSYQNNINLNINLMMLDKKLIDYVIIHELCHTVEKNHSKAFWELVIKCMPDALEARREIKKERFIV